MANDPVTGPITRDEFQQLVSAPYGEARKQIQKYDPLWGREAGEKIEYEVRVEGHMTGRAFVKAASQEEADKLADDLNEASVDWDYNDDLTVISVEPYVSQRR